MEAKRETEGQYFPPIPPPPPPPGIPVQVKQIIGVGRCEELLTPRITLFPPAIEIKDIHMRVEVEEALVCTDHVIVNAILHKNVNYKAKKVIPKIGGSKIRAEDVRCGDVRFCRASFPFSCLIKVPGARKGDRAEVLEAGVLDDCAFEFLEREGLVLREKIVVVVVVKVVREVERFIK
ncbi:MAG: DUF3794 domain-containing protein [Bacillota bacterium]